MNSATLKRHYTNIAANLLLAMRSRHMKTLLITSAVDREGKTTTAYNIARMLALTGRQTLLVDANARNPALGDLFGTLGQGGVREVLAGSVAPAQAVLRAPDIADLACLPFGEADENAATFLLVERFGPLLEELAASYEHVLIDGASVLSDMTPLSVASRVDGVLLVVRCDRTQKAQAVQARDRILGHGGTLVGVTLNCVPKYIPKAMRT